MNFDFVLNVHLIEELGINGDLGPALRFELMQTVRQGHVTVTVMMPEGFTVRGNVDQPGLVVSLWKGPD